MNKKLVLGIFVAFSAGAFWACGSGDVVESDDNLEGLAVALLDQIGDVEVAKAVSTCAENPQCAAEMGNAPSLAVQSSSSSSKPASSSATPKSSGTMSSSGLNLSFGPVGHKSSSSNTPPPSSATVQSSSSIVVPAGQYGYCTPSPKKVDLNKEVVWTFNWDTKTSGVGTSDILAATYSWDIPNGTTATGTAKAVSTTYAVSGPKTASVTVSTPSHGAQTIACAEGVNVNGSPITGCKCASTNISPDVAKGESAKWTATGCKTGDGFTLTYAWTGATADATGLEATAPVTKKGDMVTGVVLTVANDDNTVVDIPCESAKAIDNTQPDYLFTIAGNQITGTIDTVLNEGCMTIRGEWTDQYNSPKFKVMCDGKADDQQVGMTFTMTYGGKSVATGSGPWGFSNAGAEIGQMKMGEIAFDNICVTFTGASFVTCKITQ
ncbi:hypothetical protein [Fibrobacter sp. UBA4309]|uniref:hypothetical protein n=1 Tax=Fibrobacter sp. UBA4309 TaxID=1946537 RepID=UPI0025BE82F0|nr:hypothetical protein [Fibrobacter sp. UBA4309]